MNTQALPIFKVIPQIKHALTQGHNIILQAEPGAGKSTVVPLEIIKGGMFDDRKIIMLQPRRVAAKSIAHFLASALGEKVGQTVGYRVRNESKVSTMTKLEIVTEGILTQMIQHDPELSGIGLIIFDEFHERSLHADLSLMLAKEVQQSLREDMVLLVMSATIDARELESYMQNTHTISVEGRVFPVELEYQSIKHKTLESGVVSAVKTFIHQTSGDVLVFLPGVKEISTCLNVAKQSLNQDEIECLALHGALPLKEQQRVLRHAPLDKRKVVFSTNIAETSLTLPNITGVVDSGLERKLHYDPNSGMSRLLTKRISLASAEQRKGRAGRVQAGKCIRLWSASENRSFEKYHLPEILNAELTDVVLQLAKWGNLHFGEIDWITAPPKAHFDSAMTLLTSLDLLSNSGAITQLGLEVSEIGLPVRLAKTIVMTTSDQHRAIACRLAAMLSEKDVLISSESADLMLRYQVMERTMTDAQPQSAKLNVSTLKSAQILENNLFQKVRNKTFRSALQKGKVTLDSNLDPVSVIACLALFAFPERLAIRRSKNSNRYLLANGKGVCLREHDPLCQHVLLVVTDCNIKEREGLIFSAVPIEMNTLTSVFKSSLDNVKTNVFEPNTGRFFSERSLNYQSIQLESLEKADADDAFIKKTICEQLKTKAEGLLNWTEACESWVKRLIWLGSVTDDFPVFSKQNLLERADEWLLPYIGKVNKLQDLKSINILPLIKSIISWETQSILEKQAPEYYQAPSGHRVKIDYDASQGPKVSIALQEVFGELVAPKLAGKVNLRFELLSPAKRPIQITSDIGQFWHTSYFDVAKEMRAKYPKHRWPTEPLKAEAGRSIKNKRGC
jgi:ATP-dependent helicase HrpB